MKTIYTLGEQTSHQAHTIYIQNDRITAGLLSGDCVTLHSENPTAFALGAAQGPAAIVVEGTILKQCQIAAIQKAPFTLLRNDWQNQHNIWRQVDEDTWHEQLGAVPPRSQDGNRWLQGEEWRNGVYLAGMVKDHQFFFKYQTEVEYHHERLHEKRNIKILDNGPHLSSKAEVNNWPGYLWTKHYPTLSDGEITRKAKSICLYSIRVWIKGQTIYVFLPEHSYTETLAVQIAPILTSL